MLNALDNLPEDPTELRQLTELLASEVKAQALIIEKLQHQLHGANRHRFGSKSEGMEQLQLFAENEEIAKAAIEAEQTPPIMPAEPKAKPKRKPLPDHLDRIEQVLSVGEGCPDCRGDLSKLGEDITEELEYIPGRFVVNKIIRPRMACRRCEAISQAPMPSLARQAIAWQSAERGAQLSGADQDPACWPMYWSANMRIICCFIAKPKSMLVRASIRWLAGECIAFTEKLDRSTMADWVGKSTALLEPLSEAIASRVKDSAALFADDTPLKMLAPIAQQANGAFAERGKQEDQNCPHLDLCQG